MPRSFPILPRLLPVALLLAALALPADALAHRVNIFAWVEGENIVVECGFNRAAPVRDGLVTVYDAADGKELLQGRTNERGVFVFALPEPVRHGHGLRIEINAGEGHVNDWTMTAAEINEARDLSHGFQQNAQASAAPAAPASAAITPAEPAPDTKTAADGPLTAPAVRAIVAETLNSGLAPIRRELAALSSPGPSVRDIVGGLGWIMGLVGIACWFMARRRQQKP
ncbi:MAG: cobalamin biosynthesis protein CbiL [Desulfovibrio sp.]|uniref:cobalamin biosynthesis protein CbiL n=1 Tax=Desulfovibrio sp. TaxID=885 RepID=UPI001A679AFE|nr:cobalamin biosynthesis protein CbiL [Desulfovibrio sp.]MBD5417683.1 cobalamin biosynthesis protein CbiL [Desulfovibrio sp.]